MYQEAIIAQISFSAPVLTLNPYIKGKNFLNSLVSRISLLRLIKKNEKNGRPKSRGTAMKLKIMSNPAEGPVKPSEK